LAAKVEGKIEYQGEAILGLPTEKIVNLGITYIAENRELFPHMTVLENLKLGAFSKNARSHEKENLAQVFSLFPRLKHRQKQMASTMSGGEARMLAVARGLMSNADFLCIDEPSLGLQPSLRQEIFATIKQINAQGKTVLLVEQNIPQIAELADRIYVMEEGQISFEGNQDEALSNESLKEIFLGM
jgi:branched-chain amino acid transport system ATP-binding protein